MNSSLANLHLHEQEQFTLKHPKSKLMAAQAQAHLLYGLPLHWMRDWGTPFALFVEQAQEARFVDVDGLQYTDFCLGDSGAMFGHAPSAVCAAVARQVQLGFTTMLPSPDAGPVASLLAERFGLSIWQFALSASDANRFVLRWARAITGRSKLLVFNGCYHGTVDDSLVDLIDGQVHTRASLLGQVYPLSQFTEVVQFNDLAALQAKLAQGDIACVLAEPALTNCGLVLPEPGFWEQARALMRKYGSLFICDETHTISAGLGGYARQYGLEPDFFVLGKPVGGGLPCAVYGFSEEIGARMAAAKAAQAPGHSGIGTTLTGNALTLAAIRATLEQLMSATAYQHMLARMDKLVSGLRSLIAAANLPWSVSQLGARCELQFCPQPPRNADEASAAMHPHLERYLHLFLLNRGILITPFHNMLLCCPATQDDDIAHLLRVFEEAIQSLQGLGLSFSTPPNHSSPKGISAN